MRTFPGAQEERSRKLFAEDPIIVALYKRLGRLDDEYSREQDRRRRREIGDTRTAVLQDIERIRARFYPGGAL